MLHAFVLHYNYNFLGYRDGVIPSYVIADYTIVVQSHSDLSSPSSLVNFMMGSYPISSIYTFHNYNYGHCVEDWLH